MKNIMLLIGLISIVLNGCTSTNTTRKNTNEAVEFSGYVENKDFLSKVPISISKNKIRLQAVVNGKPYQFILDSGSPTILTKQVADELGLKVTGVNTGKDANGNIVKMNRSSINHLKINDVSFNHIPVLIFDYSALAFGDCFFDGGIIGSEIMSLANWQINFRDKQLILTDDVAKLDFISDANEGKLRVSGYPFYPIVDYSINQQFKDKALFDTGNTELLHLSRLAYAELQKQNLVNTPQTTAIGTFGESAGGRGQDGIFHRILLDNLSIGKTAFKNVLTWTRNESPSLIGAKLFESHIVTLDYTNQKIYLHAFEVPKVSDTTDFGIRLYSKNQSMYVGFLEKPSMAEKAGIRLHDEIIRLNGKHIKNNYVKNQCEVFEWVNNINELKKIDVVLNKNGKAKHLSLQK